ncbi:NADH-quinone oxidoreductase subunit A [Buchnera aphidicola (Cinara curvipes)]|uniref:NADH-quinone oxidoreductase subunit n=2 Tax=Buchnera aphidicola TaxID=9 RepID=A0A451D6F0_9GAMM|nr:NADH-quinone oxidoreductase subunit A [Buchnera aphidicola (Cinara curvipes)]
MFMKINYQSLCFLVFIFFSFFVCFFMLIAGYILGGRSYFQNIPHPFESGIISLGDARLKIPIKFSLIAIFFVIFDIEALYLYIWSICVRESGWIGFIGICFFIFSLLLTLYFLFKNNILEWIVSK